METIVLQVTQKQKHVIETLANALKIRYKVQTDEEMEDGILAELVFEAHKEGYVNQTEKEKFVKSLRKSI